MRTVRKLSLAIVTAMLLISSTGVEAQPPIQDKLESHLRDGDLTGASEMLSERLARHPDDAQAQYGLGIVRVLEAVQNLAQNLHHHGLRPTYRQLPFVRLPVPLNPDPEPITYDAWRSVLQQFIDDLAVAAKSLKQVDSDDVKLKLPVGLIRLDLNADGQATDEETFWKVFTAVAWRAAKLDESQQRFEIGFDRADVHWLIGYTHLLRAMAEGWLAHDSSKFFDLTAPMFFDGLQSPASTLVQGRSQGGFDPHTIADVIAAIHLMHLEPTQPERLQQARRHLLSMIRQSRRCWKHAIAETDDDREWIPNAQQTSLTPLDVNEERIAGWRTFLDEAERVLNGERLLPHWRVKDGRGINLKRVFEEPRTFDPILWAHGVGAIPYLEEGELVSSETAGTLNRIFQGRFVAFAVWFQ